MLYSTLLASALTASVALAAPTSRRSTKATTLSLKHVSHVTPLWKVVANGQAKIQAINSKAAGHVKRQSGSITNEDVSYVAEVNIGGNTWSLIVDTGSSNLWCGAQTPCEATSTGQDTGNSVMVSYGSGSFSGEEYTDYVSFGGLQVSGQSLGAATSSSGFSNVDGIIGFGPVDLTQNTVANTYEVPTFMDNLYNQGSIPTELLGVYFHPESGSDDDDTNGELTLGGTDSSKYDGSLSYFPRLTSGTASLYWGLAISSFSYGGQTLASNQEGIIDTGTTLIYIPTSAYNNFLSASGGTDDNGMASFATMPTQNFAISFSGQAFELTPEQYLVPQDQYANFQLSSGMYYSWISNGGSSGVDCIIGQKFIEQYYSAFDTTNSQVGFAPRT